MYSWPWLLTRDRPVISSETMPHKGKTVTVQKKTQIWSLVPGEARYQDGLANWPAVVARFLPNEEKASVGGITFDPTDARKTILCPWKWSSFLAIPFLFRVSTNLKKCCFLPSFCIDPDGVHFVIRSLDLRAHLPCNIPVHSSKLLLALASKFVPGFGPRRDPCPYFCSFQIFTCF
jgi:hypothetical protein